MRSELEWLREYCRRLDEEVKRLAGGSTEGLSVMARRVLADRADRRVKARWEEQP